MNVAQLKELVNTLTEMTSTISTDITVIEGQGKIQHKMYSDIRQLAQEIKKTAQALRVEILEQFKQQKSEKK